MGNQWIHIIIPQAQTPGP